MRLIIILFMLISLPNLAFAQGFGGKLAVGDKMPEELGIGPNGRKVRTSNNAGKILVVGFWDAHCQSCLTMLSVFDNLQKSAGRDRLTAVAINHGNSVTEYKTFADALGRVSMTLSHDRDFKVGIDDFGIEMVPYMVIANGEGEIAFIHESYGVNTTSTLARQVNLPLQAGN